MPITRSNFDLGDREVPLDDFKEIKERSELEPIPQGISIIRGWGSVLPKHTIIVRVGDKKLYLSIPLDGEAILVEYADFGFFSGKYKKVKLPKPTLLYRLKTGFHSWLLSLIKTLYYRLAFGR